MVLNSNHRQALLRALSFSQREEKPLYDLMEKWRVEAGEDSPQYQHAQITHHIAWLKTKSIEDMLVSNEADM